MGMTDTHFIKRQKMFSDFSFVLYWAPPQIAAGALPSRSSKDFKVRACKIPSMASLGTWRAANSFSISDRGSFSICQQTNPCQWDLLESVKKVGTHKLQFPPSVTILMHFFLWIWKNQKESTDLLLLWRHIKSRGWVHWPYLQLHKLQQKTHLGLNNVPTLLATPAH
jgi:hypothetical protein